MLTLDSSVIYSTATKIALLSSTNGGSLFLVLLWASFAKTSTLVIFQKEGTSMALVANQQLLAQTK